MSELNPFTPPREAPHPKALRRLWWWFAIPFCLMFVARLLFVNHFFYTGNHLVYCKLWQYFVWEFQRATFGPEILGPTTGSTTSAIYTLFLHFVISGIAGIAVLGFRILARLISAKSTV